MTAAVPAMVRFVRQTGHHADCGVAALSMLAGVMYEDALAATIVQQPAALTKGLTWHEVRRAAKVLGLKTRLTGRYDIEEATGVLNVGNHTDEHFVFLWEGRIVDGNGELWLDSEAYLKHYHYRPRKLLLVTEDS